MFATIFRAVRVVTIICCTTLTIAATAFAQGLPCATTPRPYGGQMLDISRNLVGTAQPGITYFYICANAAGAGEVDRYTYRQPFHLDLTNITPCDELQKPMTLDGYYYSQVRIVDPWQNQTLNPRIGWHNGFGSLKDSAGNVIATVKFEGTIGTNTSRAPMKFGVGDCYECGHHTGEMVITFLSVTGAVNKAGTIKAFYQFDAIYVNSTSCDNGDPCLTAFTIDGGTLDGINFRVCQ
ncbi:MAG TPA: hypothetical protein VGM51_19520 [Armatimonadota bacterium]